MPAFREGKWIGCDVNAIAAFAQAVRAVCVGVCVM
jgi:hypothetical protein